MHFTHKKHTYIRNVILLLLVGLCGLFLFIGCSGQSSTAENETFRNFTSALFQQEVSSNTISLHYTLQNPREYGILDSPVTYGSYSTDSSASLAALENCRSALHKFSYDNLSRKNQITFDVLNAYLDTAIKGAPFTLYDEPLSSLTGMQAQLPVLLSEYRFYETSDVDTYLALLATTGQYFDSLIAFEQAKSKNGLFMNAYNADSLVKQCRAFVKMGDSNYLYSTFKERLDEIEMITASEKELYITKNQELIKNIVFPAYKKLADTLETLQNTGENENGLCYLPNGKDYYHYVVERETGSSRSVEDLKLLTKEQISKDLHDMQKTLSAREKDGTAAADSGSVEIKESNPGTILNDLQGKIGNSFPAPPDVTTRVKYVPKAMQEYLSPAFYMIPAIDNTSENVIYVNKKNSMEGIQLYTTLAHEGYPGHLYQTTYYANTNPDPIRSILNFGGYVEGWATYAEMCSYSLAPITKDQAALMQKNSSVILGLYALADIGIHYEGWTFLDTVSFFRDYGITDTKTVESIFELIIADPANYLKYYIGYVEFLSLKKQALQKWGENFSQKKFHKAVLDIGPAPFSVVEKYMF